MGLLSSGQSFLSSVMKAEGQSITYRRGADELTIVATPDDSQDIAINGDGLVTEMSQRDFVFDFSDLGDFTLPEDGDEIDWVSLTGTKYTFKALPGSSTKCWDWMDNRHLRIAVHTKLTSTE